LNNQTWIEIPVNKVKVAERIRSDSGDIESLAESIEAIGLLQPIILDDDLNLVAGYRRLLAVQMLGWEKIQAFVRGFEDPEAAEVHENSKRKEFNAIEIGRYAQTKWNSVEEGTKREVLARDLGVSGFHLQRCKTIVEFMDESPDKAHEIESVAMTKGAKAAENKIKKTKAVKGLVAPLSMDFGAPKSHEPIDLLCTVYPYNSQIDTIVKEVERIGPTFVALIVQTALVSEFILELDKLDYELVSVVHVSCGGHLAAGFVFTHGYTDCIDPVISAKGPSIETATNSLIKSIVAHGSTVYDPCMNSLFVARACEGYRFMGEDDDPTVVESAKALFGGEHED